MSKLTVLFYNVDGDLREVDWDSIDALMAAIDSTDDDIAMTAPSLDYEIKEILGLGVEQSFGTFDELYDWYHDPLEQAKKSLEELFSKTSNVTLFIEEPIEYETERRLTADVDVHGGPVRILHYYEDGTFDMDYKGNEDLENYLGEALAMEFYTKVLLISEKTNYLSRAEMSKLEEKFTAMGFFVFMEEGVYEIYGGICKNIDHDADIYFYRNKTFNCMNNGLGNDIKIDLVDVVITYLSTIGFKDISNACVREGLNQKRIDRADPTAVIENWLKKS